MEVHGLHTTGNKRMIFSPYCTYRYPESHLMGHEFTTNVGLPCSKERACFAGCISMAHALLVATQMPFYKSKHKMAIFLSDDKWFCPRGSRKGVDKLNNTTFVFIVAAHYKRPPWRRSGWVEIVCQVRLQEKIKSPAALCSLLMAHERNHRGNSPVGLKVATSSRMYIVHMLMRLSQIKRPEWVAHAELA